MAAVGSLQVFEKTKGWFASSEPRDTDEFISALTSKWKELNRNWIKKREHLVSETGDSTLRPISDSLFILAMSKDLSCIYIGDSKGYIHKTKSFLLSGSGSDLARRHLQSIDNLFSPNNEIEQCLDLVFQCYHFASDDLFVIGVPSIIVVTANDIIDITESCEKLWTQYKNKFYLDLEIQVIKSIPLPQIYIKQPHFLISAFSMPIFFLKKLRQINSSAINFLTTPHYPQITCSSIKL